MRTLRVFTHAVQARWLPALILVLMLLLIPLAAAGTTARAAAPAISAHAAPLVASVGSPDGEGCGGASAPC